MPAPRGPVRPRTRPTFSIAIAAYQAAATIGEALESAFAQTLPPLDVAVCDDGSTDGLEAVVAPWRDRIVFVHTGELPGLFGHPLAAATRRCSHA